MPLFVLSTFEATHDDKSRSLQPIIPPLIDDVMTMMDDVQASDACEKMHRNLFVDSLTFIYIAHLCLKRKPAQSSQNRRRSTP